MSSKWQITKSGSCMVLLFFMTTACSHFPRDPEQTMARVNQGILRVGATHHPPFVVIDDHGPSGPEAELVSEFAAEQHAQIRWTISSEADLFEKLKQYELDLVVGGITTRSPYKSHAGFTQPYARHQNKKYVLAVPPGENALLLALDRFIISHSQ